MIKVIVFDFDGVIVDSERGKLKAWFDLFDDSEFDGLAKRMIPEVLSCRGRQTRFYILREIYKRLNLPSEDEEEFVAEYAARFNRKVQAAILAKGVDPRTRGTLESLSRKYPLFIVSSTPERNLLESAGNLEIAGLFKRILGRPQLAEIVESKIAGLEKIRSMEDISPGEMVYIGNEEKDRVCSQEFGCPFIGFVGFEENKNQWSGCDFPVIEDFGSLKAIAEKL